MEVTQRVTKAALVSDGEHKNTSFAFAIYIQTVIYPQKIETFEDFFFHVAHYHFLVTFLICSQVTLFYLGIFIYFFYPF